MPDISMCPGLHCQKKEECYRFTATPSTYLQAYMLPLATNGREGGCEHFWPNKEEKKRDDKTSSN